MRATILGVSAALLLIATPTAASAEAGVVRIPVEQADIESDAALGALLERVAAAADSICRESLNTTHWLYESISACRRDTVRRAVQDADIAPLSAYYTQVHGRVPVPASPVLASR